MVKRKPDEYRTDPHGNEDGAREQARNDIIKSLLNKDCASLVAGYLLNERKEYWDRRHTAHRFAQVLFHRWDDCKQERGRQKEHWSRWSRKTFVEFCEWSFHNDDWFSLHMLPTLRRANEQGLFKRRWTVSRFEKLLMQAPEFEGR